MPDLEVLADRNVLGRWRWEIKASNHSPLARWGGTPLLVQRCIQGSGRFNTAPGVVIALQGVGAALSPGLASWVVGIPPRLGLAFVVPALPLFWWAERQARAGRCARAQRVASGNSLAPR